MATVVKQDKQFDWALSSKTFVPKPRRDGVIRPRLLAELEQAAHLGFLLVTAPAGFGKTTSLAMWAAQQGPVAWLQLDARDNDLRRFGHGLISALQVIHPDLGDTAKQSLRSMADAGVPAVLGGFFQELHDFDEPLLLILDDYHLIHNETVHHFMTSLIEHKPACLSLIVGTRVDPPFPLARWRSRALMSQITVDQLRFSADEAVSFFSRTLGVRLTDPVIENLNQRVEGWPAGLQLAGLTLKTGAAAETVIPEEGNHHFIFEYLTEEVLKQENPEVRDFLLKISILDRFNGPTAAAVSETESRALLDHLLRANLFVVPLDEERNWFRFHHLFGKVLYEHARRKLGPEALKALHLRAAKYLEQNGYVAEAMDHALAADDLPLAVGLVREHALNMALQGSAFSAMNLLNALPHSVVEEDVRLNLNMIWCHVATLNYGPSLNHYLAQAEKAMANGYNKQEAGEWEFLNAVVRGIRGEHQYAAETLLRLLEEAPVEYSFLHGIGNMHLGFNSAFIGNFYQAGGYYAKAMEINRGLGFTSLVCTCMWFLGSHHVLSARLHEGERIFNEALLVAAADPEGAGPSAKGLIQLSLATIYWERGEFDKAEQQWREAAAISQRGFFAELSLVLYRQRVWFDLCRGRYDEAEKSVQDLGSIIRQSGLHEWLPLVEMLLTHVHLYRERQQAFPATSAALQEILQKDDISGYRPRDVVIPVSAGQTHELNQAIYHGFFGDLGTGLAILAQELKEAEKTGRMGNALHLRIQTAVLLERDGRREEALQILDKAVLTAAPEGMVTMFLCEREFLYALIVAAESTNRHPYYKRLRSAFEAELGPFQQEGEWGASASSSAIEITTGHETAKDHAAPQNLSRREREVLQAIARGLSNKEVADTLFISPGTVKKHLENIYTKLEVHNRTEAVAKAGFL